jgi:hypothetical protein
MVGTWKFVKGICIVNNDTIVQFANPKYEESTNTTRPYTEITFLNDSIYEAVVFCFSCKGSTWPGKWALDKKNCLHLTPRFEDKGVYTKR